MPCGMLLRNAPVTLAELHAMPVVNVSLKIFPHSLFLSFSNLVTGTNCASAAEQLSLYQPGGNGKAATHKSRNAVAL